MPATEALQKGRYHIRHQSHLIAGLALYDAYDTVREATVLVKEIIVPENRTATPAQHENIKLAFANQAKTLTSIRHHSLLNAQDFFTETDRQFVVLDAPAGSSLSETLLREQRAIAIDTVVRWAHDLAAALSCLHDAKPPVIHQSVRPGNIALDPDGCVRLLAYGLDALVGDPLAGGDEADISYSPLEQIWEGLDSATQRVIISSYGEEEERALLARLDARSDIFGLGATMYHLLTGRRPSDALERSIEMLDGNKDPLIAPADHDPKIPRSLSDVVVKAMSIKRSDRFTSAAAISEALAAAYRTAQPAVEKAEPRSVSVNPVPSVEMSHADVSVLEMPSIAPNRDLGETVSLLAVDTETAEPERFSPKSKEIVEPENHASASSDETELSFGASPSSSGFPVPVIAGALAVIVLLAIGGWFFLAGSNVPAEPAAQTQMSAQPAEPAQQPVPAPAPGDAAVATEPDGQPSATTDNAVAINPPEQQRKQQAGPKPAKPAEPAKQPEKKKQITVDDLINDN